MNHRKLLCTLIVILITLPLVDLAYADSSKTNSRVKNSKKSPRPKTNNQALKNLRTLKLKFKKDPKNKPLALAIAQKSFSIKNYADALFYAKKANDPNSIPAILLLSDILFEQKDYLEQIRNLEIGIGFSANDHRLYRKLGGAYWKSGNIPKAIENLKKAISLQPKYFSAYTDLLEVYEDQKNFYESRILLTDMTVIFGEKKEVLNSLCRVQYKEGYFDNAKTVCQKAIRLDSKLPDNHIYLALSFDSTNNSDRAKKIIFQAGENFPGSEIAQYYAAYFYFDAKNYEQASKSYSLCTKADLTSWRCFMGLGESLYHIKEFSKAKKAFLDACHLDPNRTVNSFRTHAAELRLNNETKWSSSFYEGVGQCSKK